MARKRWGKILRDLLIFVVGLGGFAYQIFVSNSPNLGVMAFCTVWVGLAPFINIDEIIPNIFGRYNESISSRRHEPGDKPGSEKVDPTTPGSPDS